ncbi:MAG: hypothetical protein Q4A15_12950 [Prevotellaceae bacterium]|nr:hypothetical protein [Prevotellaceae bacterium]
MYELSKSDWKKYKDKISSWQENYMERLLKEYVTFLQMDEPASKRFWELEKRIKQDKRCPGVLITNMSKSSAIYDIATLVKDEIISIKELDDFSADLQEAVNYIVNH